MMDAVSDTAVETVVLMTSAQVGKTSILKAIIGFYIDRDPSPLLLIQPTIEMAETFSKDRLAPMIRDTPCLTGKIADPKSRASANTMLHKQFPGGHITMAGANSPASLASRPIRVVLCDEVDRYPVSAGSEGDPVNLARKRTATFWNRKIVLTSTPTIKGASRIEMAYENSDRRRYYVPCPHCQTLQVLTWSNLKWDDPRNPFYACHHCGAVIEEREKGRMLLQGEWRAEAAFTNIAGFHLCELYSPWRRWGEMVVDFLEAKQSTETLKTFINTSLGETFEEAGDQADPGGLMARRETYPAPVPNPVAALTAGVDVQGDRIELEVVGWGAGEESWNIDYRVLIGDTTLDAVWDELADALRAEYQHESGGMMPISFALIDSGYLTKRVFEFARKFGAGYVLPSKGVAGARSLVETERERVARQRAQVRGHVKPTLVGVDEAKLILSNRMKITTPGAGYMHFPDERDEEYFLQLTAEKLITRIQRGFSIREWTKTRPRNEALDCRVYAYAAYKLMPRVAPIRFDKTPAPKPQQPKNAKRSSYLL